ncbi:hypothetical protein BO94DRAFT_13320 [Aspergillus sclerotioniger CBS 115572]|uniref:Uncharacterized protein n=1 Tax=Aspergillus sclerotioniger CBS 115572 TaxID=1450535 RepID=A0A317XE84_9EURO|nr:hypothetical protein BO94DRAFT_13320 [Aspergillus sclerotioniger CBS 115572]PWY96491.1 hypothetical protein BO94DRAFT_13320 [Aspergillus sclerotioniger CBS 115572]
MERAEAMQYITIARWSTCKALATQRTIRSSSSRICLSCFSSSAHRLLSLSNSIAPQSLAQHLGTEWMAKAMKDPCLFHATLFSASASIDMLTGTKSSTITLHHQTRTIQLLNERLTREAPDLSYSTVGTVVPLLFYSMATFDKQSAISHQMGIIRMLLSATPAARSELGPLLGVIKLTMLFFSCVFDTIPVWSCLYPSTVRPKSILRAIITSATCKKGEALLTEVEMSAILDIYEIFSQLDHLFEADVETITSDIEHFVSSDQGLQNTSINAPSDAFDNPSRLRACCNLSASIFRHLLMDRPFLSPRKCASSRWGLYLLKQYLGKIDELFLIHNHPELLTWIVFTGAAACNDANERGLFILQRAFALMAVNSDKLPLMRQGWKYFTLLRKISGANAAC